MSKQEDFGRSEKLLEITREINNKARISKKSRNEKKIQQKSEADNSVRHPAKLLNILDIIHKQKSNLYQNDKEIKPIYQVLRVSCKRVLQSSACI